MTSVLVTGGAGYIGSHTCKALSQAGYRPVVYDNFSRGHSWAALWGPIVRGDILQTSKLIETIQKYDIKLIVHLAALSYVDESVKLPTFYNRINVSGTISVLEAMRQCRLDKLIFAGSCASYGESNDFPIVESHEQRPMSPYGSTKLYIERLLSDFSMNNDLDYVVMRYFNVAGADPEGEIGEYHCKEFRMIPRALQAALGNYPELKVFSAKKPTLDGSCIRDFVHVHDVARANLMVIKRLLEGAPTSSCYNICSNRGYSMLQVINKISEMTRSPVPVRLAGPRKGDPDIVLGSSKKFTDECGWRPDHSSLEEIIATALNWLRNLPEPNRGVDTSLPPSEILGRTQLGLIKPS